MRFYTLGTILALDYLLSCILQLLCVFSINCFWFVNNYACCNYLIAIFTYVSIAEYWFVPKWLQCLSVHSMPKHLNFWILYSIYYIAHQSVNSDSSSWLWILSARGIFSDYCSLSFLAKTQWYCLSCLLTVRPRKRMNLSS